MRAGRVRLRYVADGLIAASAGAGLLAIAVRAVAGGSLARALEGATLSWRPLRISPTQSPTTKSEGAVDAVDPGQCIRAPGGCAAPARLPGHAVPNDIVIVLFVVDLALLVSPWR